VLFAPDGRHGVEHWVTSGFFVVTPVTFGALIWLTLVSTWDGTAAWRSRRRNIEVAAAS